MPCKILLIFVHFKRSHIGLEAHWLTQKIDIFKNQNFSSLGV